jgi:hypothetical protein
MKAHLPGVPQFTMAAARLVIGGDAFSASKEAMLNVCRKFQEDPDLLARPYRVQSRVTAPYFRLFADAIASGGANTEITPGSLSDLDSLCLSGESVKNMDVEQGYVIKFFADEGMPAVEIISRLRDHYGEDALPRTEICFSINEIKRGRTDLNNIASPGTEPDEGLVNVIAAKLHADPHLSARKLTQSLRIATSMVCRCLSEVLGIK